MQWQKYIGCPDCDLLHCRNVLPPGGVAVCSRCGATLYSNRASGFDHTLALAVTGVILFLIANFYPFLSLSLEGQVQETILITGVIELYQQGLRLVALLVLVTGVIFPLVILIGLVYILLPLKLGLRMPGFASVFRIVRQLQPWAMMEVFLLGILVSMVKLVKMAEVIPGIGFYAFLVLVFLITGVMSTLHPESIWERLPIHNR